MHNYFVVLLRNLYRERLYALINIAGLSLGVASFVIIGLYLRSELTYDRYIPNHENIYRVVADISINGKTDRFAVTARPLAPMLMEQYPGQVKAKVQFIRNNGGAGGVALRHGDTVFYWEKSYFVSPNVFEVFPPSRVIYGDVKTAMNEIGALAVSETFARKYFGNANPIGEVIATDAGIPLHVKLVYADQPANTHLKYDVLFSDVGLGGIVGDTNDGAQRRSDLWNIGNFTYLVMQPGFKPADWDRIDKEFFAKNMEAFGKTINGSWHSYLQPLADIHLNSDLGLDEPVGNKMYLYACAAVAVFILLIACINYMNLATARASRRARSVGIRKILGASRASLALQFIGESMLFSLIALVLGVMLVEVILRLTPLNSLMGEQVSFNLMKDPVLFAWLLGLGLVMGLLSGLYPAFYLSSWAPLTALTGKQLAGKGSLRLREGLVLLQFTISAAVIACTLLMAAQMRYVSNKSLGFQKENRLIVHIRSGSTIEKIDTIRKELQKNSHVLGVSHMQVKLGSEPNVFVAQVQTEAGSMERATLLNLSVGDDMLPVLGLKLKEGRDFSHRLLTDVGINFIANETLVRKMGWTHPIGKQISFNSGSRSGRVIGVVEDFNFRSLHKLVEPLVLLPLSTDMSDVPDLFRPLQQRVLVVNISGEDVRGTLDYVEDVLTQADPRHPFEYEFLDSALDNLYRADQQLMALIGIFAAICIFIACLGLFGLAAFATEQRTREIGTRKVLGATSMQIITLLARRIMVIVLIAAVVASVISYFAMDEWLTTFAYRAGINPLIFVLAAAAAAAVAFGTVALQSLKTARADPVLSLRHVDG
jgi:putative ABC transport system permease protein